MPNSFFDRRHLLRCSAAAAAAVASPAWVRGQESTVTNVPADAVTVINPRGRVPLSFIIDDSTCLVNMGHFCMPQFAEAWPQRDTYKQPWKDWPREIPDAFVREFGEWCASAGVKGKYSIVPYPACVGWLDRNLPGWSRKELNDSLALVRDLMMPHWDIHPEMITHTRVIDLKTGRPLEGANASTMENSYPQTDVSTDYLTEYLAYALRILKNCGLNCEGITTPGGFGNKVKTKLPVAVHQAVRDVYGAELPHYFKYIVGDEKTTAPKMEWVSDVHRAANLTVNVPAGTGDWFGGWEGVQEVEADRYCNADATSGRMVELIERGEPAILLCHWPGMYCNGSKVGFQAFQRVVESLATRFGEQTLWMKVSEIARYWAAKETTKIRVIDEGIELDSQLDCPAFTLRISHRSQGPLRWQQAGSQQPLRDVDRRSELASLTTFRRGDSTVACIDLKKGITRVLL